MAEEIGIVGELHGILERRPFQPFTIVMDSGQRYPVTGLH